MRALDVKILPLVFPESIPASSLIWTFDFSSPSKWLFSSEPLDQIQARPGDPQPAGARYWSPPLSRLRLPDKIRQIFEEARGQPACSTAAFLHGLSHIPGQQDGVESPSGCRSSGGVYFCTSVPEGSFTRYRLGPGSIIFLYGSGSSLF